MFLGHLYATRLLDTFKKLPRLAVGAQADDTARRRGGSCKLFHLGARRFASSPHEAEKLREIPQPFRAILWKVWPKLVSLNQRPEKHTPKSQRRRTINPYQDVGSGNTTTPSRRVAAFKYPAVTRFNLATQAGLFVLAPLDPSRLPVDRIDMNDRQLGTFTQFSGKGGFS